MKTDTKPEKTKSKSLNSSCDWLFPAVARSLFEVTCALLLFLLCCTHVQAQLVLSPTIVELKTYPGGIKTFTIDVGNIGAIPLDCRIDISAMEVLGGGLPVAVETAPRSCKDWITLKPDAFTLRAKEGRQVVCRVRTPRKSAGGYYALVSCHAAPIKSREGGEAESGLAATISFSYRSYVAVMLTVPGPDLRAIIEAGKPIFTQASDKRGYSFDLPVRNRGSIHARITGRIQIRSEAGQTVEQVDLSAGRGFILPEHERLFRHKGTVSLPDGIYLAYISLTPINSKRPMRNTFSFFVRNGIPQVREITDELRQALMKETVGFLVSPMHIDIALRAGGRRSQALEVINLTRDNLPLHARVMEWARTPDGKDLVSEEEPFHGYSGRELISLRQTEIDLPPLGKRRIPLTFSLPPGTTGERYVAVTVDRKDLQLDSSPTERARRSTLISMKSEGTGETAAEISSFEAIRKPTGAIELKVQVKNTGNVSFVPEIVISVRDENNNELGKMAATEVSPSFIQAGGECVVSLDWLKVLNPGVYTAVLAFRFDPNKPPMAQRANFEVPELTETATAAVEEQNILNTTQ